MISDDIIYVSLLCISVALGPIIRNVTDSKSRQLLSSFVGFGIAFIVSGFHIIHPLIVIFVNAAIVLCLSKRLCHIVSAAFCFTYLAFFRSTYYFGFSIPPPHTNAIQMILTLKMVGLAFEVKHLEESTDQHNSTSKKYRKMEVTFLDVFQYAFCVAGVLIGPYYKYKTYWDLFHAPYSSAVPANKFLRERIRVVPLYVGLFLIGNYMFPLEFASSSKILEEPFWYRVFYMIPSFFNFRMRIYAGFILGECVCIAMGLGAYPSIMNPQPGAGPTNYLGLEQIEKQIKSWSQVGFSYETIKNIDEYGSEFRPLIREGIRSWNRTVQYWLANFVYKNINASKPAKIAITMLVSSFWHGVHAGYYLCLCSAPLFLIAEREIEKTFPPSHHPASIPFNWVWWAIKMLSFSYMGMAFLLLDMRNTLYYWKSIYFIGHVFIIAVYLLGLKINKSRKKTT